QIRKTARRDEERREDDVVGVQHPRQRAERAGGKGGADVGKGDVDDRRVEECEKSTERADHEHARLADTTLAERRCERARRSCYVRARSIDAHSAATAADFTIGAARSAASSGRSQGSAACSWGSARSTATSPASM